MFNRTLQSARPVLNAAFEGLIELVQRLFRDYQKQITDVVSVQTAAGGIQLLDTAMPRVCELLLAPYALMAVAP